MDYVQSVLPGGVVVRCASPALREALGASAETVTLDYADPAGLARVLRRLQSLAVPFVAAGPTPPADVFDLLREAGRVSGEVRRIVWRGPQDPVVIEP